MTIAKDYTGDKYGRLTLLREEEPYISSSGLCKARMYLCKCECGNETIVALPSLRNGNTKSCGCLSKDLLVKRNKENAKYEGYKDNPHFSRWKGMIERCYYPKHKDYHRYGGRGIRVCDEWKDHPKNFIEWVERESNWEEGKGFTLDRKDYDEDYQPSNCEFLDSYGQAMNKGVSIKNTSGQPGVSKFGDKWRARITFRGKRKSLGVFDNKEDAIEARRKAELDLFGRNFQ